MSRRPCPRSASPALSPVSGRGRARARRRARGIVALLAALASSTACGGEGTTKGAAPAASFLVAAGDSTYWVESDGAGVRVRRSSLLLTEHGGRFYELYLTDLDRSYFDAVILGQRVWRRDVASGDSLLLLDDSALVAMADDYAARHPQEVPLAPDEEAAEEPSIHATTETELLDAAGPFLMLERHVDIDVVGVRDHHVTRRAVLDVRDGHLVTPAELVGARQAGEVIQEGRRLLETAIDSIRRASDERARRAATALTGFVFDSLSFTLIDIDGAPAVAFMVPGRGARAGGYALPLPPIPIVAGPWWTSIRDGLPVPAPSTGPALLWRGEPYDIVARDDSVGETATLGLRVGPNEWPVAQVQSPVRRTYRLDPPHPASAMVPALRRTFDEASLYSGESRTASHHAAPSGLPFVAFTASLRAGRPASSPACVIPGLRHPRPAPSVPSAAMGRDFPLMRGGRQAFLHAGSDQPRSTAGGGREVRTSGDLETGMTRKFSLEEANRMLPLVSRIVRDIMDHYREWQRTVEAFEIAAALSRSERPAPEAEALQQKAQLLARDIQGFVSELSRLDLEFKGYELGLVDFPADVDGRNICWCWKHGEESVSHWHDADAGYNGRQPVDAILDPSASAHHD